MCMQTQILQQYQTLFPESSLKVMSEACGIQLTRFFRILNGAPMKLSEYEKLKIAIEKKYNPTDSLTKLADECARKLSFNAIQDIANRMKRNLKLSEMNTENDYLYPQTAVL